MAGADAYVCDTVEGACSATTSASAMVLPLVSSSPFATARDDGFPDSHWSLRSLSSSGSCNPVSIS